MKKQSELLFEKNWKTLIILDACRFDRFSKVISEVNIEGKLLKVNSECCNTQEWYVKNWNNHYDDVILVSANPRPWNQGFNKNFYISTPVWKGNGEREWLRTRETINETLKLQDSNPQKRFIVHTLPPHLPFIGKRGTQLLEKLDIPIGGAVKMYNEILKYGRENGWCELREYYEENILESLRDIKEKIGKLLKPVVLTSDHAELIGELNLYGHDINGKKFNHPKLKIVPWFEVTR